MQKINKVPYSVSEWLHQNLKGDRNIWIISILLLMGSIPIVYSASVKDAYTQRQGDTEYYLIKHVILCLVAVAVMFFVHRIPYTRFARVAKFGVYISMVLLIFTALMGKSVNDAARWIEIPLIGQRFQPSEFAKVALITNLSLVLARHIKGGWSWRELLPGLIFQISIICALILVSNVSSALLLAAICFMLMFVGRVPLKYLLITMVVVMICGGAATMFWSTRRDTATSRWSSFMNKDTVVYQSKQSYMAMARGGIQGEGLAKSRQRRFLPEPQKDFIYAVLVEEFGTIGGLGLILLYMGLLYRGLRAMGRTRRPFGGLLSAGHSFGIVFQALIAMAVTVGLLPVTGQTLPFFSQGGTSMILTALSVGMILSASRGEIDEKVVLKKN